MSSEHTPGPWIVDGTTVKAISHGQWFKICRADGLRHTVEGNRNNARLIAAAPEMLQALQTIAAGNTDPDRMVEIAAEVLAQVQS